MSPSILSAHAQVVATYVDAITAAYGPLLNKGGETAELARAMLALALATADCTSALAQAQRELEDDLVSLGIRRRRTPQLRLVE